MSESTDEPNGEAPPETSDQGPKGVAKLPESARSRKARLARLRERSSAYSLHELAKKSEVSMPDEEEPPVSGTIHLDKLPKTSEVQSAPAILDALPALALPEAPAEAPPETAPSPPEPKSKVSLAIGAGAGAVAIVAVAIWATRTPPLPASAPTSLASAVATPSEPILPVASAASDHSAPAAISAPAPSLVTRRQPARTAPPAGSPATTEPAEVPPEPESTAAPDPIPTPPPKPPPPASPCGCKPNDLKCNIDCAVKGK